MVTAIQTLTPSARTLVDWQFYFIYTANVYDVIDWQLYFFILIIHTFHLIYIPSFSIVQAQSSGEN